MNDSSRSVGRTPSPTSRVTRPAERGSGADAPSSRSRRVDSDEGVDVKPATDLFDPLMRAPEQAQTPAEVWARSVLTHAGQDPDTVGRFPAKTPPDVIEGLFTLSGAGGGALTVDGHVVGDDASPAVQAIIDGSSTAHGGMALVDGKRYVLRGVHQGEQGGRYATSLDFDALQTLHRQDGTVVPFTATTVHPNVERVVVMRKGKAVPLDVQPVTFAARIADAQRELKAAKTAAANAAAEMPKGLARLGAAQDEAARAKRRAEQKTATAAEETAHKDYALAMATRERTVSAAVDGQRLALELATRAVSEKTKALEELTRAAWAERLGTSSSRAPELSGRDGAPRIVPPLRDAEAAYSAAEQAHKDEAGSRADVEEKFGVLAAAFGDSKTPVAERIAALNRWRQAESPAAAARVAERFGRPSTKAPEGNNQDGTP